jgi:hypothetical protein
MPWVTERSYLQPGEPSHRNWYSARRNPTPGWLRGTPDMSRFDQQFPLVFVYGFLHSHVVYRAPVTQPRLGLSTSVVLLLACMV